MENIWFGIGWVLKDDQYFDSGVCESFLGLGLSFGFTGRKVFDSAIVVNLLVI